MNEEERVKTDDPFLLQYQPSELQIASEFLTRWLPFLSTDLCPHCTQTLSDRILSLHPENVTVSAPNNLESEEINENCDENCDTNSLGSWKDEGEMNFSLPIFSAPSNQRLSWADMAQEDDELEEEEEEQQRELTRRIVSVTPLTGELRISKIDEKPQLSRERREYIRFMNVKRKKDFICLERVKGKFTNILDGLELHTGIFSAAEQKRIVDYVYLIQEMGRKGELKG